MFVGLEKVGGPVGTDARAGSASAAPRASSAPPAKVEWRNGRVMEHLTGSWGRHAGPSWTRASGGGTPTAEEVGRPVLSFAARLRACSRVESVYAREDAPAAPRA